MKPSPKQNGNRPRAIPLEDLFADIEQGSVWEGFSHISEIANCLLADYRGNRMEREKQPQTKQNGKRAT